jgi:hypothetical protein
MLKPITLVAPKDILLAAKGEVSLKFSQRLQTLLPQRSCLRFSLPGESWFSFRAFYMAREPWAHSSRQSLQAHHPMTRGGLSDWR